VIRDAIAGDAGRMAELAERKREQDGDGRGEAAWGGAIGGRLRAAQGARRPDGRDATAGP
jgi:hypothetical protein